MRTLPSFLNDAWVTGRGPGEALVNPTTEEPLAETAVEGLDLGAALAHARAVGGAELRALSFAERGAVLAAMSRALHGAREELIELAVQNGGNTRSDAKFDIDGATGTLMAYAGLGERLGAAHVLPDGDPVELGGARLQGQHVSVARRGVAVHIGAFNFPTWGWAEKAASALLAGMPVFTKPAPATALVTARSLEVVLGAGVLPRGALSLLSGAPGALLEHLGPQDVIAFTGSSATGQRVRSHPRVLAVGARVNVEADSLNAAVLLPGAGDAAVDAFVRDVARDITQKAGQKCTAIRRVLVPQADLERVRERVAERLAGTVIGDPARDDVRMGPVCTAAQRDRVVAGLAQLREVARVAWAPEPFAPLGVAAGRGYFVAPHLLEASDPSAPILHELEVFGPVATLLPWDGSVEGAAALVQAGGGGLVVSLYGDDRAALGALVAELLPWHGRVVVIDSKIADRAMAPGTVLPELLHGGPGRAGGGEELGGLRSLALYRQRVAVQGNGALLTKLLGGAR